MKIHRLEVTNFRGFDQRTFTLSDQFNVLIGENGAGKTAVLDALAIGAGSFLVGITLKEISAPFVREDDVRRVVYLKDGIATIEQQFPVQVQCTGRLEGEQLSWRRSKDEYTLNIHENPLLPIAATWQRQVQAGQDITLPLLSYYGTGRLWLQKHEHPLEPAPPTSRLEGYIGCLDPASNQKLLLKWAKRMELVQLQQGRTIGTLEAVKTAVVRCMVGWKRVWFDINQDDLLAEAEDGRQLPFRMLSDGVRNMLAMVADIAYRAAVLNPHLGERAAEQTPGIVLIDEIDLHLHPKWQRRVVDDLRTTFPQVQFVATTHSPFIIQSLRPGELINLEEPTQSGPPSQSIEDIAEQVMGVEVPQRSERYQKMMEAAEEYYRVLQEAKATTSPERRESLKLRLDELSAPFSDNVAYHAFLRMEREAAGLGQDEEPR
ncbi:AAA family ATPase [Archangium violaceum]|uniref:AAA family ATPase n=1 Tax=Archangium violaceum TaxID=83451 RepID=UPI0019525494|nr:AAA family ATPase [Archangium violaceum]QRN98243.1 AAA family ATPase [Archangium violaceum]